MDAEQLTDSTLKEQCMRLLALREHSQQELMVKLQRRGFNKTQIQPVLNELHTAGWQNDQRYAECYARQRLANGFGWQRVAYELRLRGVTDADISFIKAEFAELDSQELLMQVYEKKYGTDVVTSRQEWAKRMRFLLQRGFSGSMLKALNKFKAAAL